METGRTIYGVGPAEIIPPIEWDEFAAATLRYAKEVAYRDRAHLGAGEIGYTVLTLCRALLAVRLGTLASKQEAALWLRGEMPRWAAVVDAALAARRAGGQVGFEDRASLAAAEDFIREIGRELDAPGARGLANRA